MTNILVVEDDALNQELLSEQIEELGEVETASNGRHAIHHIRKQQPDLIVLDLNMPEMNGFELIESVRTFGYDMPMLVITAMDLRKEDYAFFRDNNVQRVFEKGRYSADEFIDSVRRALTGVS
jgi:CheY-like chemotaxis protein